MTKTTTALVSVGPSSVGPWGDRAWRIGLSLQLVEGGSPAYWLMSPIEEAEHPVQPQSIAIDYPDYETTVRSLVLAIACVVGSQDVEQILVETHNLELISGIRQIAPFWDLSDETVLTIGRLLATKIRIAVTMLDDNSLLSLKALESLLKLGFDVEVYKLDQALTSVVAK